MLTTIILWTVGFTSAWLPIIDTVLIKEARRKELRAKFENWWIIVDKYDKQRFPLVWAVVGLKILEFTIGKSLKSRAAILKTCLISSGLLLLAMVWLTFNNEKPFGGYPWENYRTSINTISDVLDTLVAPSNTLVLAELTAGGFSTEPITPTNAVVVNVNKRPFLFTISTNTLSSIKQIYPIGHGGCEVFYFRKFEDIGATNQSTNIFGGVLNRTNVVDEFLYDVGVFRKSLQSYNTISYAAKYSITYYALLFVVNFLMFYSSLVMCKRVLIELASSGRLFTTFALLFTHLFVVCVISLIFLLGLTFFSVPIFWLLIPILWHVAETSFYTFCAFLTASSFAICILIGSAAKQFITIAILPNIYALIVGALSLLTIRCKNIMHWLISTVLLRCFETSPITILGACIAVLSFVLYKLAGLLHISAFL